MERCEVLAPPSRPSRIRTWLLSTKGTAAAAFSPVGCSGRWNRLGVPLVYTAESAAGAALELMAALKMLTDLSGYRFYSCTFEPADVELAPADLDLADIDATRAFGTAWARSARTLVLDVPSSVLRGARSYLLNPWHPHSGERVRAAPRSDMCLSVPQPRTDASEVPLPAWEGRRRQQRQVGRPWC